MQNKYIFSVATGSLSADPDPAFPKILDPDPGSDPAPNYGLECRILPQKRFEIVFDTCAIFDYFNYCIACIRLY